MNPRRRSVLFPGNNGLPGENSISQRGHRTIARGQVKVNTAAKANHAEAFTAGEGVTFFRAAHDAARDKACDLHEGPGRSVRGFGQESAAFVIFGGLVQGGVEVFAGPVGDVTDSAGNGHAVYVHAEEIHENGDADACLPAHGILLLLYAHDFPVCGTHGAVRIGGNNAFGIPEEMQGEPDSHEGEHGQQGAAEQSEDDGADCGQKDDGIAFWRDGAVGFAHGMTSGKCQKRRRKADSLPPPG